MTDPKAFITSVRVQTSAGGHEYVSIWIRGASVGTLCVGKGDAEHLVRLLQGCSCSAEFIDRHGVHMFGCRMVALGDRVAFQCAPPAELREDEMPAFAAELEREQAEADARCRQVNATVARLDGGTPVQSHPRRPRLWPPLSREEYLEKLREFERGREGEREAPLSAGLKQRLTERQDARAASSSAPLRRRFTLGEGFDVQAECTLCGRLVCNCTAPSTCGRCHGCALFDERPFHVDPSEPPTLMDVESPFVASADVPFAARTELTPWMRGSLDAMRVPEPEGATDHTKAGAEPGALVPSPEDAEAAAAAAGAPELT